MSQENKIKEVELKTWEEFEETISSIYTDLELRRKETGLYVSDPLFRGQENSSWKLETTLERLIPGDYGKIDYYQSMLSIKQGVESYTDKSWPLNKEYKEIEYPRPPQGYEFMIYLRHHGFPSPLLDWSRSPYVAAFFAFRSAGKSDDENASIFSYVEYYGEAKGWSGKEPTVLLFGPNVTTHKRHYIQQCEYTICQKRTVNGEVYSNHEDAFKVKSGQQDILTKYLLPRNQRSKFLERLYLMNINAFTLFANEESLMEMLAYQEIEKRYLRKLEDHSMDKGKENHM